MFTTCEVTSDYFQDAYGALTRVKAGPWRPFVPVSREARRRIYEVSPAFREIGPVLEGRAGDWAAHGRRITSVCDEIGGGWFLWAFRNAVGATGMYRRGGASAADWYRRLASEIDSACSSGRLECGPARSTLASPWNGGYLGPLLRSAARGAVALATFDGVAPVPAPAQGSDSDLDRYERITHEDVPRSLVRMVGRVESRAGKLLPSLIDARGKAQWASISTLPIPGDHGAPGGVIASRVDVETRCTLGCELELVTAERAILYVPLPPGDATWSSPLATWRTEGYEVLAPTPGQRARARLSALASMTVLYRWATRSHSSRAHCSF